jgi:hypothetical protein
MRLRFALAIISVLSTTAMAQVKYFPAGSLAADSKSNEFVSNWYSGQLAALEEPSLWESSKTQKIESYRFLWLRTFHHPVAIRMVVNADGTSRLTKKISSGAGGYAPGKWIENEAIDLTKEQTDWFLRKIAENRFWQLSSFQETPGGCDGSQWIIEGTKNGSYHLVDRWTPRNGEVHAIGLAMMKELAKLKVPAKELY